MVVPIEHRIRTLVQLGHIPRTKRRKITTEVLLGVYIKLLRNREVACRGTCRKQLCLDARSEAELCRQQVLSRIFDGTLYNIIL